MQRFAARFVKFDRSEAAAFEHPPSRQRNMLSARSPASHCRIAGLPRRSASAVESKRRTKRWRRLLRSRRPRLTCTSAIGCASCGRKTTPICSKACARPDGRDDRGSTPLAGPRPSGCHYLFVSRRPCSPVLRSLASFRTHCSCKADSRLASANIMPNRRRQCRKGRYHRTFRPRQY
jgi:hypothetical protein